MIKFIRNAIPMRIRLLYSNFLVQQKYDVIFEKGASSGRNTVFEGKNLLKQGAQVFDSYIGLGTYISGKSKLSKAKIGRFCSIGQNVENAFGIHPTDWVSTHPCFYSLQKQAGFTFTTKQLLEEHKFIDIDKKYYIDIGNDVWIGNDVKIMDGIKIGNGAIIAAGSIVTKDVEDYSIIGGVPAKPIRYRFSIEEIRFLTDLKWWSKDPKWLLKNHKYFNSVQLLMKHLDKKWQK